MGGAQRIEEESIAKPAVVRPGVNGKSLLTVLLSAPHSSCYKLVHDGEMVELLTVGVVAKIQSVFEVHCTGTFQANSWAKR